MKRKPPEWAYRCIFGPTQLHSDRDGTITAWTKAEARAALKARLGILRKGRLPFGVAFWKA